VRGLKSLGEKGKVELLPYWFRNYAIILNQ
jgi:hypothetical protein